MSLGDKLKKFLYIALGALASAIDVLATVADYLEKKGGRALKKGKAMYDKLCEEKKLFEQEDEGEEAPVNE